jgi:mono/diheme cytochrome c family protein
MRTSAKILTCAIALACLAGCRQDMHDQPRYEPFEASTLFADGRASRPQAPGTIARGQLREDEQFFTGFSGDELIATIPVPVTRELLERGRQRFNIFCSPCHGRRGDGQGMIARRGFRSPPSYHIDRLRGEPIGHFFDVMTNGLGSMYDFADRIPPADRWAIAAYIRTLQLSQAAELQELPEPLQSEFNKTVTE